MARKASVPDNTEILAPPVQQVASGFSTCNPHQSRVCRVRSASNQGEMQIMSDAVAIGDQSNSPNSVSIRRSSTRSTCARWPGVSDQVGDGAHFQPVSRAKTSSSGRRAMLPSGLRISTSTAAGSTPANRASPRPLQYGRRGSHTPPGWAISGKM